MLESVSVTATIVIDLKGLEEFDSWVRETCAQFGEPVIIGDAIDDRAINYALTCVLRELKVPGAGIRTHSEYEEFSKCNL